MYLFAAPRVLRHLLARVRSTSGGSRGISPHASKNTRPWTSGSATSTSMKTLRPRHEGRPEPGSSSSSAGRRAPENRPVKWRETGSEPFQGREIRSNGVLRRRPAARTCPSCGPASAMVFQRLRAVSANMTVCATITPREGARTAAARKAEAKADGAARARRALRSGGASIPAPALRLPAAARSPSRGRLANRRPESRMLLRRADLRARPGD